MNRWKVRVTPEGEIDAGHRHGLGYVRAEILADETGTWWAKCTRCGESTMLEEHHPDPRALRR